MLTDSTTRKPTAANIRSAIRELVEVSGASDVNEIFLSYSGHGSHVRDQSGDEADGQDETLVPLDYLESGHIKDDELYEIFSHVGQHCRVTLLFDSCHSGSVVDLHYRYSTPGPMVEENARSQLTQRIVCLSGCTDATTSADAYIAEARKFQGAMTTAFLDVLGRNRYNLSCFDLLNGVQKTLEAAGHSQLPQLSCTQPLQATDSFSGPGGFLVC
jgi:hypothetical protein